MQNDSRPVLAEVAKRLNAAGLTWCAGASYMLDHYGILPGFHDIDIIVEEAHAARADAVLSAMGRRAAGAGSDIFASEMFIEYTVGNTEIDLISGFSIRIHGSMYRYLFDERSVTGTARVLGEKIPLAAPEDWFILYLMMPGKEEKSEAIGRYLKKKGILHPELLERAKKQMLPRFILEAVNALSAPAAEK